MHIFFILFLVFINFFFLYSSHAEEMTRRFSSLQEKIDFCSTEGSQRVHIEYACKSCPEYGYGIFETRQEYDAHIIKVHLNNFTLFPLKCNCVRCDKTCNSLADFIQHLDEKHFEPKFVCRTCSSCFTFFEDTKHICGEMCKCLKLYCCCSRLPIHDPDEETMENILANLRRYEEMQAHISSVTKH